jgi:hypothetical protein
MVAAGDDAPDAMAFERPAMRIPEYLSCLGPWNDDIAA